MLKHQMGIPMFLNIVVTMVMYGNLWILDIWQWKQKLH